MSEPIHSTDASPPDPNDALTPASPWPPPRRSFARTPENAAAELAAVEGNATKPSAVVVTKETFTATTFEKVKAHAEALLTKPNSEAIGGYAPGTLRATAARVDGGRERFRVFITWEPNA